MIERRPFHTLPGEDLGWLKIRHHVAPVEPDRPGGDHGCIRSWSDEEFAPNSGFGLTARANVEIITYVRDGAVTHRDSLGNEGRIEAGDVQVISAGTGIRHAEYNLDLVPARLFQIRISPSGEGGLPGWASQPCPLAGHGSCFVAVASGCAADLDALPLRAQARLLNARLRAGEHVEHSLHEPWRAYLVPSRGAVDVNGIRIHERDGAAIQDVETISITAVEDADVVILDFI